MTNENFDEKMMQRALGLVEGIAFGMGEYARDVLLGAAEDIDSGIKALEKRAEEAEKEHGEDQLAIRGFLRSVDELRTENTRLRDMLEKMATEGGAEEECDDEIATAPADPRNDSGCLKMQTDNPSVACSDSSPCTGEPLGADCGCDVCKEKKLLWHWYGGKHAAWLREKRLVFRDGGTEYSCEIVHCPICGRKL